MPSFGLTQDPYGAYGSSQAGHADFIHDFLNAICVDRTHIAGNSMGCMNTVNYTVAHPERIISFALIAGFIGDLVDTRELAAAFASKTPSGNRPSLVWDGTKEGMRSLMAGIIFRGDAISDDLVEMRTRAATLQAESYNRRNATRAATDADPNYQARMRTKGRFDQLTIPGIYMYGKNDVLVPHDPAGYLQEDVLPAVQFFYPDNTGHQGQTDSPELFNQTFLEFFRDGKVSWETAQRAGISDRRPVNPELVDVPSNVEAKA
jgi:pimeloyl-ACP methyl ester carboxylesterase